MDPCGWFCLALGFRLPAVQRGARTRMFVDNPSWTVGNSVRFSSYVLTLGMMALLLSGCMTSPERMSDEQREGYLIDADIKADRLLADGKREDAIGVLADAAEVDPARKGPWIRMAKIYFDNEQYGHAISASEEVLHRDPSDTTAKSVRAVSGLRVATESLRDLRDDADTTGSARSDAENLAKVLRETLGEEVLVPPVDQERLRKQRLAEAAAERRAHARKKARARQAWIARKKAIKEAAASKAAAADEPVSVDGDPFNILK